MSVVPSSKPKLLDPQATIFVEVFFQKKNLVRFWTYLGYPMKGFFDILKKNGILKFFERVQDPEPVIHA